MATNFRYADQSDLMAHFNRMGDYDQKIQVFNWVKDHDMDAGVSTSDNLDAYFSTDVGMTSDGDGGVFSGTLLFVNGTSGTKLSSSQVALTDEVFDATDNVVTIDSGHGLSAGDIILIGSEYMEVASLSTNDITVVRGIFGSPVVEIANNTAVKKIFDISIYKDTLNQSDSVSPFYWYKDSDRDTIILIVDNLNPNEQVVEIGRDVEDYVDQQLVNASLELNNLIDARIPTPIPYASQVKNSAHNLIAPEYDPIIIKSTCYIAAANIIRGKDVMSEEGQFYMDMVTNPEGTGLVDRINAGHIKLSFEVDNNDSSGSIREITRTGTMWLQETSGEFYGGKNGFDVLRITCTTAGGYGTAKCKVEYYGNDAIYGSNTTDNIVTGGYEDWEGLGGLKVRFQGWTLAEDDSWEIEVYSEGLEETNSITRNINLHR